MDFDEISELIRKLNTHPCKPDDVARALTVIQNIFNNVVNNVRKGTYMGKVRANIAGVGCDGDSATATSDADDIPVHSDSFELWGIDDPDDPVPVPESVENDMSYLVQNDDWLTIAYDPNGNGSWHLVVPKHKTRTVVVDVGVDGDGINVTKEVKFSVAGGYCLSDEVIDWPLESVEIVSAIRLDTGSGNCPVMVTTKTVQVFAASGGTETQAWQHQQVSLVNDVYRVGNNVYTFSYDVWVPCLGIDGSRFRFNVCCPDEGSGSGSGEGCCCLPDTFTGTITNKSGAAAGTPGMPDTVTMTGTCPLLSWSSNTFTNPCYVSGGSFPPTAGMTLSCADPGGWTLRGGGFTINATLISVDCETAITFHVEFNDNGCVGSFDITFDVS